jgi:hypothetical protein
MPLDVETRSSITPTVVVKKIWVPSATVPPPSATALKAITVIVDSPLIRIAVGLALIEHGPFGRDQGHLAPAARRDEARPTEERRALETRVRLRRVLARSHVNDFRFSLQRDRVSPRAGSLPKATRERARTS